MATSQDLKCFMEDVRGRNPHQPEFVQAMEEVAQDVMPLVADNRRYRENAILERLAEPDRVIGFRVCWQDDDGRPHVQRAWRVQYSNAVGPYKGGLRFHPKVDLSTLKFLGLEQVLKCSLTGLLLGGAKGGADFSPKGKSDGEVMRFCQAMMSELHRHIGDHIDVPAGDIGVGKREIGYLFGQYKRLTQRFAGVVTGKQLGFGGSGIRTEATGYGLLYFVQKMLEQQGESLEGKRCAISGAGNVSLHAAEKALALGARVITLSDSGGAVYLSKGMDAEQLELAKRLKLEQRCGLDTFAEQTKAEYRKGAKPWEVECDIALPCATENELDEDAAKRLAKSGCQLVAEGANMPSTPEAIACFHEAKLLFAPGKAANAGGVAVSGLEQSQNALQLQWSSQDVNERLHAIMAGIHERCVEHGREGDYVRYARGANVAGFQRVADALCSQGLT